MPQPQLSIKERKALLEVANDVATMCEKNKESKEYTTKLVTHALCEATAVLTEYKRKHGIK